MDARYANKAKIKSGSTNEGCKWKLCKSVPNWISRMDVHMRILGFRASLLYNYTGSVLQMHSIRQPNASEGSTGLVPAYQIVDFNFNIKLSKPHSIKMQYQ